MSPRPRLLVSVRSLPEAELAVQSGVELLDVKDPDRGSLGMANPMTIREICQLVRRSQHRMELSVACGELTDLMSTGLPPLEGCRPHFAKIGLSQVATQRDWVQSWQRIRENSGWDCQWIAVAYVDHLAASSPPLAEVVVAAQTTGCRGVLLDTWSKSSGTLLDFITFAQLAELRNHLAAAGLLLAVAGRIPLKEIPYLIDLQVDIIAVRSGVCEQGDRRKSLDPQRLRDWLAAVQNTDPARLQQVGEGISCGATG